MAKKKLEINLKGELTGIDIVLEGIRIIPREINDNDYYKIYNQFEIQNPLDIHIRLDGWIDMKWEFVIKIDNKKVYSKKGKFTHKGFVTFNDKINI